LIGNRKISYNPSLHWTEAVNRFIPCSAAARLHYLSKINYCFVSVFCL
jgi:hypothetical protein